MGSFIATARNRHLGSVHLFYDGDVVPHDADMQAENGPQGVVLRVLENDAAQSREGVIMTYTYESAEGPTKSRPVILATCSGVCNVGQLTTQAVMHLIRRSPGSFRWMKVEKGKPIPSVSVGDTVWAIVGCEDRCACKELEKSGIPFEKTVVATDLGIVRDIRAQIRFDEIDRFAEKIRT